MFKKKKFLKGFTLIELMMVVIIIGVLASFAVPQYFRMVAKAKGAKAKHALALIAQAEQIVRTESGSYVAAANSAALEAALGEAVTGIELTQVASDTDFGYGVTGVGLITATPKGSFGTCKVADLITFDVASGVVTAGVCWMFK